LTKKLLIKTTSAIFLAIVLVTGTIALSIPSFMIGAAQASSDREKDHDNDDKKKSYGKDRDRDDKSRDHDKYDDKKSYGKDSYESQYSSYEKDNNNYKSKKDSSSSSVSIKKVKCNNINVNLNGLDVNIGASNGNSSIAEAQASEEDEGETITSSFENDERNNNGYNQNDKDFKFVCINNNNNTVLVAEEEPEPEPETCEECFTTVLTDEELDDLIQAIEEDSEGTVSSLQELCDFIAGDLSEEGRAFISDRLFVLGGDVGISEDKINEILDCLEEVFGEDFPREILEPLTVQQQMNWKS